ncbi:unnamed protein product [Closterium sp. NIES-54]
MAQTLTGSEFKSQILESERPALVCISAAWSSPCRRMLQIYENIAEKNSEKFTFYKLDSDANPQTNQECGIFSLPAFLVFKDGQKVGELVGITRPTALEQFVERISLAV